MPKTILISLDLENPKTEELCEVEAKIRHTYTAPNHPDIEENYYEVIWRSHDWVTDEMILDNINNSKQIDYDS
jgi:hypothetical protein